MQVNDRSAPSSKTSGHYPVGAAMRPVAGIHVALDGFHGRRQGHRRSAAAAVIKVRGAQEPGGHSCKASDDSLRPVKVRRWPAMAIAMIPNRMSRLVYTPESIGPAFNPLADDKESRARTTGSQYLQNFIGAWRVRAVVKCQGHRWLVATTVIVNLLAQAGRSSLLAAVWHGSRIDGPPRARISNSLESPFEGSNRRWPGDLRHGRLLQNSVSI